MTFIVGFISGVMASVLVVVFILYCISKTGEDVAVYKYGKVNVGGKSYPIIGKVPFWDGERITGRYEIMEIDGIKYAAYITNN